MIVREVRLENIKSYGSPAEVIKLYRGVNAICGANGSGKSTILEAIGCTLFQHLPYGHAQFVREGQSSGTIAVVVESRFDGRTYEVVRRVGKNRPLQYVHDPEVHLTVAQGEADVRRWLHQHLQIPDEVDLAALFVDAVGPLQGTLTAPFLEGHAERKAKFNRLLRVQEYEEAWARLRNLDNALAEEENQLGQRVSKLEGQTAEKPSYERQRATKVEEQAALGLQLSRYLTDRDQIDQRLAAFREGERAWSEASNALSLAQERERYALERQARARADWEASRRAAEIRARSAAGRETYVQADRELIHAAEEQRARDELRAEKFRFEQLQTRRQGELERVAAEIEAALAAGRAADELEARIPEQEAAEERLHRAQAATREAKEIRERSQAVYQRGVRAKEMKDHAEADLARAKAQLPLRDDLPRRQAEQKERASELARATRAEGQQAEIRQQVAEANRRGGTLRTRLAELDRALAALRIEAVVSGDPAALQDRLAEASGQHALAQSSLKHAKTTRVQVAGGLCPFLQEPCQNLRPGVTLERHFDEEIARWTKEAASTQERLGAADRALKAARLAEERRARAQEAERERLQVERDLAELDEQERAARARLREVAALATNLTAAREAERFARQAVAEAETAIPLIASIPDLAQQVADLTADLDIYRAELQQDRKRLAELQGIDAEVAEAARALKGLGAPRETAVVRRQEAGKLSEYQERHAQIAAALTGIQSRLDDLDRKLEPFAGLDERIATLRSRREVSRVDYEAYLAATPSAELLEERQAVRDEADADARRETEARETASARLAEASRAYRQEEHARAEARRRELDHAIGDSRARIDAAVREEEQLGLRLAAIAELERELEELKAQRDRIAEERQVASSLRNAIRAAGPEITRQLLARISRTAGRINGEILNQPGIDLEWTPEYEIVTRRQGEQRGFAQLSGGEQMAAAMAVRLAVLRDLSNVRIAFLDEPTAHLDQERRTNLGDQVQRLQGFDQLVVISHDDTFDGLFGHVVRLGRQNGASKVLDVT